MVRVLVLIAALAGAAGAEPVPLARTAALALPEASAPTAGERRCTASGAVCITLARYVPDVCRAIEGAARRHGLDPHFLARLIWQESRFDAGAVSPAGAQGIAQFMPGTAALRGLGDAFNPAEALEASASYLADLARDFGSLGMAAVAYNGGEARAERFRDAGGGLPGETRAYVLAITGVAAETWRDSPPARLDLRLDRERPFRPACEAQAAGRGITAFRTEPVLAPWGVILASARDQASAERQVARLGNRHAALVRGEPVVYRRGRVGGMPRAMVNAQIGRESRRDADAFCARLRAAGGACMVLRNR
jgi:soluble lytic murein transglycosylase-like protein